MSHRMPLFLKLVMGVGWLVGGLGAVFTVAFLALATGDIGPYTMNGALVSKEEFLAFALPVAGGHVLLSLTLLATSWGLSPRLPWARPLLVAWALGSVLIAVGGLYLGGAPFDRRGGTAILLGGLTVLSLWWYLYRDDSVVSYYDALQTRPDPTSPGASAASGGPRGF